MLSLLLLVLVAEMLAGNLTGDLIRPSFIALPAKRSSGGGEQADLDFKSNLETSFKSNSTSKRRAPKLRNSPAGVFPEWLPLACDGTLNDPHTPIRPTATDINGQVIMLMHRQTLYFFYEMWVVKVSLPTFEKLFANDITELTDKDVQLVTSRPYYALHKNSTICLLAFCLFPFKTNLSSEFSLFFLSKILLQFVQRIMKNRRSI